MFDDESNREDAEQPTPEGAAEEPTSQEEAAAEEPAEQPEAAAEEPAAEEAGDEPAAEAEGGADEAAAEGPEAEAVEDEAEEDEADDEEERKSDEPPGASLEPLRIEDENLDPEERARLEAEAEERARREAEATADRVDDEQPVARSAKVDLAPDTNIQATGKRKSAVARVIVRRGNGAFQVNGRDLGEYFPRHLHQTIARQPLVVTGFEGHVDVRVRVHGGGLSGQADAVRHGIARALCEIDPELRPELKRRGFLTRDARVKERRKAGLKKARKRPQFSKR